MARTKAVAELTVEQQIAQIQKEAAEKIKQLQTALPWNKRFQNENVDSYGGEDMGSDYWAVYSFSKDNEEVFVKFYGWYASHYGSEYRGNKFVTPQQKTITVYK